MKNVTPCFLIICSVILASCTPSFQSHQNSGSVQKRSDLLLNELILFGRKHERVVLGEGDSLRVRELEVAVALGIQHPEKVKVHAVPKLPPLEGEYLRKWARAQGFLSTNSAAYAFGYGIIVRHSKRRDRGIIAHELAHVAQYERLGFEGYLHRYIEEVESVGYRRSPLENEARAVEARYRR